MIEKNDLRIFEFVYNSGDIVYLFNNSVDVGLSKKLKPIYKVPYIITVAPSHLFYGMKDHRHNFVIHHDRLLL